MREAVPISVEWTDPEAEFYAAFERWQIDRARALRLPVGFVTPDASSALRAPAFQQPGTGS